MESWLQVHEEVLRLLLAALPKLGTAQLAHYLQETLKHSRKSRKCAPSLCLCVYLLLHVIPLIRNSMQKCEPSLCLCMYLLLHVIPLNRNNMQKYEPSWCLRMHLLLHVIL